MSDQIKMKRRILTTVHISQVFSVLPIPSILLYVEKEAFENAEVLMLSLKFYNIEWITAIKLSSK